MEFFIAIPSFFFVLLAELTAVPSFFHTAAPLSAWMLILIFVFLEMRPALLFAAGGAVTIFLFYQTFALFFAALLGVTILAVLISRILLRGAGTIREATSLVSGMLVYHIIQFPLFSLFTASFLGMDSYGGDFVIADYSAVLNGSFLILALLFLIVRDFIRQKTGGIYV